MGNKRLLGSDNSTTPIVLLKLAMCIKLGRETYTIVILFDFLADFDFTNIEGVLSCLIYDFQRLIGSEYMDIE